MSRLSWNDDGPIGESGNREEIELRMNVIAEILQHDDHEIVSERAGRRIYGGVGITQSVADQRDRAGKDHEGLIGLSSWGQGLCCTSSIKVPLVDLG